VNEILEVYGMNRDSVYASHTPMLLGSAATLYSNRHAVDPGLRDLYQSLVGKLLWLSRSTRYDITYAVARLCQHSHNPSISHWHAALHVLKYLKYKPKLEITYKPTTDTQLYSYTDSDFANDESRKSQSGSIHYFLGAPLAWESCRQRCVSLSSCEAEYVALVTSATELLWLKKVLIELDFPQNNNCIFVDNKSAISMCTNNKWHSRTKHVDIRYHWIRALVQNNTLRLSHVSTCFNHADLLTKALGRTKFTNIMRQIDNRNKC
jgi:hypothetical protein